MKTVKLSSLKDQAKFKISNRKGGTVYSVQKKRAGVDRSVIVVTAVKSGYTYEKPDWLEVWAV